MDNINDAIERYEQDFMNNMVKDNIESPDELQDQMDDFDAMSFDRQRDADDIDLSLTGKTNQERNEEDVLSILYNLSLVQPYKSKALQLALFILS